MGKLDDLKKIIFSTNVEMNRVPASCAAVMGYFLYERGDEPAISAFVSTAASFSLRTWR